MRRQRQTGDISTAFLLTAPGIIVCGLMLWLGSNHTAPTKAKNSNHVTEPNVKKISKEDNAKIEKLLAANPKEIRKPHEKTSVAPPVQYKGAISVTDASLPPSIPSVNSTIPEPCYRPEFCRCKACILDYINTSYEAGYGDGYEAGRKASEANDKDKDKDKES